MNLKREILKMKQKFNKSEENFNFVESALKSYFNYIKQKKTEKCLDEFKLMEAVLDENTNEIEMHINENKCDRCEMALTFLKKHYEYMEEDIDFAYLEIVYLIRNKQINIVKKVIEKYSYLIDFDLLLKITQENNVESDLIEYIKEKKEENFQLERGGLILYFKRLMEELKEKLSPNFNVASAHSIGGVTEEEEKVEDEEEEAENLKSDIKRRIDKIKDKSAKLVCEGFWAEKIERELKTAYDKYKEAIEADMSNKDAWEHLIEIGRKILNKTDEIKEMIENIKDKNLKEELKEELKKNLNDY